ncbi:hypothetical protein NM208_g1139 [Fusarium decemcellulare]|uniref:Uncharacterized protein n=1 Tax=Fusarium decemcellulare TaxID=57161 RepID=A0ACC1SX61_9HYPO|nr:hypothetical protein NM208_g1139 [Fusarium decemcellulare]
MRVTEFLLLSLAAATPVACASASKPDGPFQLYAYGDDVGGLVLFSDGERVYAGEHSLMDNAQAAPIIIAADDGQWSCSPNTTALVDDTQPTWSNLTFAIPGTAATSHDVQLLNATHNGTSAMVTDGFSFYGAIAFATNNGAMVSQWQGIPSRVDGVYSLQWNNTEETDGAVIFTLKATKPNSA